MFVKEEPNNDYKFIYSLFLELNETFLNNFCNIFDKYIFSPGKTKDDFFKYEVNDNTKIFNITESLNSPKKESLFKRKFNELNFGSKIFKLLYIKLVYTYDYVLQLLYNEYVVINTDWETNINQRYDELSDKLLDKNTKFIETLRSSYMNIDFLFKEFSTDEEYDKEYERMEKNLLNDKIEYNYTLENIFRMELTIMDQIFSVAKDYYIMLQNTKSNLFADRKFSLYEDFDYKSFNKPKHTNGKLYIKFDDGYYVNDKLLNESLKYKFSNQLKSYYNLIFLPFILRLNDAITYTTTDNNTTPYEFEHSHPFSPFTTKSLYNLSFNIIRNNLYKEVESTYSSSIIKQGYNDNELKESYLYRQKQSLMVYLIYHINSFYNLNFSIFDRIKESTERITSTRNILVIDDPNPFTMSQIKLLSSKSYFGATLKIRQNYHDNEDISLKRVENITLNDEINRYNKINKIVENDRIGKDFNALDRYQFFFLNIKIHDYIKIVLSNDMDDYTFNNIIDILNTNVFKKNIINNKDLELPNRKDFNDFLNNIKERNIVYENTQDNIILYNTILLLRILTYLSSKTHSEKKLFYSTLNKEDIVFKEWRQFIYYAYIPYYIKTIIPEEEKPRIIKLQPPSEFQIK